MESHLAAPLSKNQRVSHNLINALASVRSLSELLVDYPELSDDERIRFLSLIREEVDRLIGLFAQLTWPPGSADPP